MKLDKFDCDILEILQKSNRTPAVEIGEKVGLSTTAVQRRINRLRKNSVISADVSVVSRHLIGRPMTFIVQVSLEREYSDLLEKFKEKMKNCPDVQQCYYVTGSSDFIIIVTAADMEAYEQFRQQNLFDSTNVKHLYTNVVMDVVKADFYIPTN